MPLILAPISAVLTWLLLRKLKSDSSASYEKVYNYEELNRTNEFIA
jgi:hypothetical protein